MWGWGWPAPHKSSFPFWFALKLSPQLWFVSKKLGGLLQTWDICLKRPDKSFHFRKSFLKVNLSFFAFCSFSRNVKLCLFKISYLLVQLQKRQFLWERKIRRKFCKNIIIKHLSKCFKGEKNWKRNWKVSLESDKSFRPESCLATNRIKTKKFFFLSTFNFLPDRHYDKRLLVTSPRQLSTKKFSLTNSSVGKRHDKQTLANIFYDLGQCFSTSWYARTPKQNSISQFDFLRASRVLPGVLVPPGWEPPI